MPLDPKIGEQAAEAAREATRELLDRHGITGDVLIKHLKAELAAKVTRNYKVRGAVSADKLKKGQRVVATSGVIVQTKEGDEFGDGDTIIEHDEVAWDIRQRARMDAHKLRGDYAPERVDATVRSPGIQTPEEIEARIRAILGGGIAGTPKGEK